MTALAATGADSLSVAGAAVALVGLLLAVVGFLATRTLKGFDGTIQGLTQENRKALEKLGDHGERLAIIRERLSGHGARLDTHEQTLAGHGKRIGRLEGAQRAKDESEP